MSGLSPSTPLPIPSVMQRITRSGMRAKLKSRTDNSNVHDVSSGVQSHGSDMVTAGIRCPCESHILKKNDLLVECALCSCWCHRRCVNVSGWSQAAIKTFVCPFCTGEAFKRQCSLRSNSINGKRSKNLAGIDINKTKLSEVPDRDPKPASIIPLLRQSMQLLISQTADELGYDLIFLPPIHAESPSTTNGSNDQTSTIGVLSDNINHRNMVSNHKEYWGTTRNSYTLEDNRSANEEHTYLPVFPREVPEVNGFNLSRKRDRENDNPTESQQRPPLMKDVLTDTMIEDSMECCKSAILNSTFSESYPLYCLKELQNLPHRYLQGTFARDRKTKKVVSLVLTNGMDVYGNLKNTIGQLKAAMSRAGATNAEWKDGVPTSRREGHIPAQQQFGDLRLVPFMWECAKIQDVSGFVHFTLIATHADHRGKGLAKRLMLAENLRWLMRGRTQSYLNVALERIRVPKTPSNNLSDDSFPTATLSKNKTAAIPKIARRGGRKPLVPDNDKRWNTIGHDDRDNNDVGESNDEEQIVCVLSETSRRLYLAMGYQVVFPRFDPHTGENRWTVKEEETGRVMVNADMKESSRSVAKEIFGNKFPFVSGRRVLKLKR
eukprot:Tbor_TRINITY_DN5129_c0_g1::TRINITY_DN5129_c0_g1_i1::g.26248::m.26248